MARMKIRTDAVLPGDVVPDLNIAVEYSEPHTDYMWHLECIALSEGEPTVHLYLPNDHRVMVVRA